MDLSPLWYLRHNANSMLQSLTGAPVANDIPGVRYLPTIPSQLLTKVDIGALDRTIDEYLETVMGGACMLDSMFGFRLGVANAEQVQQSAAVIQTALSAGFGYVTSTGGRLILTLDMLRAALPLQPMSHHSKLRARKTDVNRTLRNFQRAVSQETSAPTPERKEALPLSLSSGARLSLRVNTNFKLAVENLRAHHKQAWVGHELEVIWKYMHERRQMIIFELWLIEGANDSKMEMIAADVGHPVGHNFYVATRSSNTNTNLCSQGFCWRCWRSKCWQQLGSICGT